MTSRKTPSDSNRDIAILGAGAIGQLIYHQLNAIALTTRQKINFISRDNHSSVRTLSFTRFDGIESKSPAQFIGVGSPKAEFQAIGLLIVCVKAYQVQSALMPLLPLLASNCHILLLHNGMGPHLSVTPILDGKGLSLGTTSQGALRFTPWHVKQTGQGLTQIGYYAGPAMPSCFRRLLLSAIESCQWCEPILPMLWQKLAVNATINPLTAIHNCKNGELAAPAYLPLIKNVVAELVDVARRDGIELDRKALILRVLHVIELTAGNYSSMQQDIAHRRKSEIESINGYIVERAKVHGIQVPTNLAMFNKVSDLEAAAG